MLKPIFISTVIALAAPAFADDGPTKANAAFDNFLRQTLQYCKDAGRARAERAMWCPEVGAISTDCRPIQGNGVVRNADQNLTACVSERLTTDELKLWSGHPLNPLTPFSKQATPAPASKK